jgi:hypothetical protein
MEAIMLRWELKREHRRQKRNALLLLAVAGAVRPADIEIRYRGTDRLLGTWSSGMDLKSSQEADSHRSIWSTDIRQIWKRYRHQAAPGSLPY